MKEIKSIIQLYKSLKSSGERCGIAQVVRVEESSYRREGARMLVFESGVFEGGISGGCLEGDALKRSQIAILKGQPSIVTYDTSKEKEIGVGLGCNGVIDVLISPISEDAPMMQMLQKCVAERSGHIIVTVTAASGIKALNLGESFYYETQTQTLGSCTHRPLKNFMERHILTVLDTGRSNTFEYRSESEMARIFIEYIPPQFHLAIYGDNYDVYPLLDLAQVMDWEVSLVGNIQKLKKERLRSVKGLYPKDAEARPTIDTRTAVLLMAHDYKTDMANLMVLMATEAPYIASLGPRKRFEKMVAELQGDDIVFSEQQLNRIFAPCGLEVGANTPEEIAVSIFGEILSVFSGKHGGMLRDKLGPIHDRH